MATSSAVLFLLLAVFAASASAATFTITNNCGFTVWPAGIPVGGGFELGQGQTSSINVPAGTNSGKIWGRTGCSFNGGRGSCETGDCGGALSCTLAGKSPTTLAQFSIGGAQDFYDISTAEGYNLAMDFSCSTGDAIECRDPRCKISLPSPDNKPVPEACNGNSNYQITFCP